MADDMNRQRGRARAIDLTIDISSSLESVWQALTTAEGLASWFAPRVSATPGAGGSLTLSWGPGEDWVAPIVAWEPNVRLGIASDAATADGRPVRLAIDFHLEARGGLVTVRLVHSGFDDNESWDDYIDGLTAGWSYFLINLRYSLERHPGVPRVLVSARPTCRFGIDEGLRTVFGAEALDVQPDVAPLAAGQSCSLALGGRRFPATVAMSRLPRAIAFAIPELNDALLFVEREGLKTEHRLGIWLSVYGVPVGQVRALEGDVGRLGARLAASVAPV